MQKVLQNPWVLPVLAMFMTLAISSARLYFYLDGVLSTYAESFRPQKEEEHYVYWTFHTKELQQLINSINDKKEELTKKEEELKGWEDRLKSQKAELTEAQGRIEQLRGSIESLIVQSKADEMKNLKSLSATYAAMTPDGAVAIFAEMDDNTVVKLLALMKPDTVGPIFEAMGRLPGQESQMKARIARISEKLRLYRQAQQQ
jgi:flagellar motility protein MotE (MotC chaperone)